MASRDQLLDFLRMTFQTDHERILNALADMACTVSFPKGTLLFRAGDRTEEGYLLYDGIVRMYYVNADGEEVTEWLINRPGSIVYPSYELNMEDRAKAFADTVTECTLVRLRTQALLELTERHPEFAQIRVRKLQETLDRQARLRRTMSHRSPSERYAWMVENRPQMLEQVPQKYMASFLAMTPVSLSRIRSRYKQKEA